MADLGNHNEGLFSYNIKPIKRSEGQNIVACAAYISGQRLRNDTAKKNFSSFTHLRDRVLATGIITPPNAPQWMHDRADLWNAVEKHNVRSNAQLGRRIIMALPLALPREEWLEILETYARDLSDSYGVVVDYALHEDKEQNNPHAHLIITDNEITATGFGPKIRQLGRKSFYFSVRDLWEKHANEALQKVNSNTRIYSRSYSSRGVDRTATHHRGYASKQQIKAHNREREGAQIMSKEPTQEERLRYPNLTRMDDWPPRFTSEMTQQQQAEFSRYEYAQREPERSSVSVSPEYLKSMSEQSKEVQQEYERHLDNDDREHDTRKLSGGSVLRAALPSSRNHNNKEPSPSRLTQRELEEMYAHDRMHNHDERIIDLKRESDEMRERARNKHVILPKHERDRLKEAEKAPILERGDAKREAEHEIMRARIAALKEQDSRDRKERLDKEILRAAKRRERDDYGRDR